MKPSVLCIQPARTSVAMTVAGNN